MTLRIPYSLSKKILKKDEHTTTTKKNGQGSEQVINKEINTLKYVFLGEGTMNWHSFKIIILKA